MHTSLSPLGGYLSYTTGCTGVLLFDNKLIYSSDYSTPAFQWIILVKEITRFLTIYSEISVLYATWPDIKANI